MSQKTNTHFGFSIMMFVVIGALIALIAKLMCGITGEGSQTADMNPAAVEARIKPVAQLNTGAPIAVAAAPAAAPAAGGAARSGDAVYGTACIACHGTGAAGAPKLGDKAAWAPRIAQGMDALFKTAINGKGAMPPKGTCGNCSDAELKAAIEHMVNNSK